MKINSFVFKIFFLIPLLVCYSNYRSIAQSKFADKYKSKLEPGSYVMDEGYCTTLEKTTANKYIRKIYFPETKQITHFITYDSINQKTKHGLYQEWYDNGKLFLQGNYENGLRSGKWLSQGSEGIYELGLRQGKWTTFIANSKYKEEYYTNDTLEGWVFYYNDDGIKTDSTLYSNGLELKKVNVQEIEVIEIIPKFPGGNEALYSYINRKIKYPKDAKKYSIQGTAIVNFIVENDGSVAHVKVKRGLCQSIKENCYKIFTEMPVWSPGSQNGKPVRVEYSLPIMFKLDY